MKNITILVFLLGTTFMWSQTHMVSGDIKDEANIPIAYANILLLKSQDSTIVSGTTSDEDGKFSFNDVSANSYIIKTSFISYKDNYTNIIVNGSLRVPTIILEESIEALSEIQLTYRKPTLKREVDRLVFNVEKSALSEGNMMDVLRNTPSVIVMDDAITVKGSSPTIYINDRKVHISSDEVVELLQGTSASNIKSVEVITNPPARYDAESGVVLNIVMSKNLVSGYNGSLFSSVTQGVFPKSNFGMTNYFKGDNISLFANYSYNDRKRDRVERETIDFENQEHWVTDLDKNSWSETHNFNFNFDWNLNDRNTVSVSANTQFLPHYKRVTNSNTQITPIVSDETARFVSNSVARDKKQDLGFDFDFVHRFENNARLSFNSHYTNYDNKRGENVSSVYYLGNGSFESTNTFRTQSKQDAEILTSQIDYSLPINDSSNFELGVKVSNVKTNSDLKQYDVINGIDFIDVTNTDAFNYDESVYAGYVSFDKSWESWSLSTGLRVEQTDIDSKSISTNQINNQNYLEWFPTFNLGHQVSEKVNIYTNYKRSLERPSYVYLNPFRIYLNDNTYVTGNPELKPIFTDQVKLGVSINDMFVIETYYKKYKNNIFELPLQNNDNNTLAHTSVNIDYTEEIGLDFEANFNIVERWSVYFGTSFYNYKDNATFSNNSISRDIWSNYSILQNNLFLLKDNSLTVSLNLVYIHETMQALQIVDTRIDSNLSLRKTILKGKGTLSLLVSDLFNKQDSFWTTKFADQNNTGYTNLDNRYIRLGFRYKFGNTKLSTNERSSSVNERDRLGNKH